mgnify:CR=1 FL=1
MFHETMDCVDTVLYSTTTSSAIKCAAFHFFHETSPSVFNFDKESFRCSMGEQLTSAGCTNGGSAATFAVETRLLFHAGTYAHVDRCI